MRFLKTIGRSTTAVSILLQLFFSAYLSLLVIWTNAQAAKVPWVEKLQLLIAPGKQPHSFMDPELLHAIALLWGVLALVVFVGVRILSHFSNKLFFQTFVGVLATVGFPLAYMCTPQHNLFTVAETVAAAVCVVLYSLQKWRMSKFWSVLLLSAHFAVWIVVVLATEGSLRPGLTLLWPGYNFAFGQHPDMIYPALGCCSSLLWVLFVTQQRLGIGGRNGNFKQQASRMHANTRTKLFHEAVFSLNVGLTCMIVAFGYGRDSGLESWLYRLNSSINNYLHIAQTDLATNGFVFSIFGLALALCAWALLRLSSNSSVTREILRSVAGFLALAALPAMETNPWSNVGPFTKIAIPLEILFTLYFAYRYLYGQWPQTAWAVCGLFSLHFMFWSHELGLYGHIVWTVRYHRFYLFPTIAIAWIVACSSAVLWGLYVAQLRQGISSLLKKPLLVQL